MASWWAEEDSGSESGSYSSEDRPYAVKMLEVSNGGRFCNICRNILAAPPAYYQCLKCQT